MSVRKPEVFYNARLINIVASKSCDHCTDELVFDYEGSTQRVPTFAGSAEQCAEAEARNEICPCIGKVGIVSRAMGGRFPLYQFHPYIDQTLRRAFELDIYGRSESTDARSRNPPRLGWRNATCVDGFLAPEGVIPGRSGQFVPDDTIEIRLAIPPEFVHLCEQFQLTPEHILRGFIADVTAITSPLPKPRADGYCCSGQEEHLLAFRYLERGYGMWRE
jgi:hypothetical protein